MTAPVGRFKKDPLANLDYPIDWSRWLAGDVLATSTWTVPAGLTLTQSTFSSTIATGWLSGGVIGQSYIVRNLITTQGGRTDERSIEIDVENR